METPISENSEHIPVCSNAIDENHDNSDLQNHGDPRDSGPVNELAEDEVRGILEVIAASGKFWHDWEKLKNITSFYLKQVLSEYPEAKMSVDQQNSSLGEAYPELVKRLDDALHSFIEGPPFTLQRLCEILLAAQNIYPNLSKLALALEKNLLVTSTLTISTDPYPPQPTIINVRNLDHQTDDDNNKNASVEEEEEEEEKEPPQQKQQVQSSSDSVVVDEINGGGGAGEPIPKNEPKPEPEPEPEAEAVAEPIVGDRDRDEIMTEASEVEDEEMTIDMETFEEEESVGGATTTGGSSEETTNSTLPPPPPLPPVNHS